MLKKSSSLARDGGWGGAVEERAMVVWTEVSSQRVEPSKSGNVNEKHAHRNTGDNSFSL